MDIKRQITRHKKQSIHYLENAFHFIKQEDAEKASEFLWGAMTQALKAVALSKDKMLKSHNDIRKYAFEFRKSGDEDIYYAFSMAQSLHSNFYETGLSMEDVNIGANEIKKAMTKLLSQIPGEN
jgi:hypothetical protein